MLKFGRTVHGPDTLLTTREDELADTMQLLGFVTTMAPEIAEPLSGVKLNVTPVPSSTAALEEASTAPQETLSATTVNHGPYSVWGS